LDREASSLSNSLPRDEERDFGNVGNVGGDELRVCFCELIKNLAVAGGEGIDWGKSRELA